MANPMPETATYRITSIQQIPQEQVVRLRQMGNDVLLNLLRTTLVLGATLSAVAGYHYDHPAGYMVALLLAVVAVSAIKSAPHIRHAVLATQRGMPSRGNLTITAWSDTESYQATVTDRLGHVWEFEFIPQGWKPEAGESEATIYTIPSVAWPVLVSTTQGLLFPRYQPKRILPIKEIS